MTHNDLVLKISNRLYDITASDTIHISDDIASLYKNGLYEECNNELMKYVDDAYMIVSICRDLSNVYNLFLMQHHTPALAYMNKHISVIHEAWDLPKTH